MTRSASALMMRSQRGGAMDDLEAAQRVRAILMEGVRVKQAFMEGPVARVVSAARAIVVSLRAGGKLLIFGNGGSAADAQHIAAEFVNRFSINRAPLAAIALTTDTSVLTSISNDEDFKEVFARQVRALGKPGDVAWGITTSGRSPNVLRGLQQAKRRGMVTIGLTGGTGGEVGSLVDHWIHVDCPVTARVQEVHIVVGHILYELVEEELAGMEKLEQA